MQELGKILVIFGVSLTFIGVLVFLLGKLPFVGHLPGDFHIKKENVEFYAPIGTAVLISLILSLLLTLISYLRKGATLK